MSCRAPCSACRSGLRHHVHHRGTAQDLCTCLQECIIPTAVGCTGGTQPHDCKSRQRQGTGCWRDLPAAAGPAVRNDVTSWRSLEECLCQHWPLPSAAGECASSMHRCRFCAACLVTGGIRLLERMEVGSRSSESVRSEKTRWLTNCLQSGLGCCPVQKTASLHGYTRIDQNWRERVGCDRAGGNAHVMAPCVGEAPMCAAVMAASLSCSSTLHRSQHQQHSEMQALQPVGVQGACLAAHIV